MKDRPIIMWNDTAILNVDTIEYGSLVPQKGDVFITRAQQNREYRAQRKRIRRQHNLSSEEDEAPEPEKPSVPKRIIETDDQFWAFVDELKWMGGDMNHAKNVMKTVDLTSFMKFFNQYYKNANTILEADQMFVRNPDHSSSAVISHMIACGKDGFNTLCGDMAYLQEVIANCEYLNFMKLL